MATYRSGVQERECPVDCNKSSGGAARRNELLLRLGILFYYPTFTFTPLPIDLAVSVLVLWSLIKLFMNTSAEALFLALNEVFYQRAVWASSGIS